MTRVNIGRTVVATMAIFFVQPLTMGAWFALIPHVKAVLGLSKAELAFALLGSPIAMLLALQVAGPVVSRFGPRRVIMVGVPVQALIALMFLMVDSGPALFFALLLFGAVVGFNEIAINVYSGRLEKMTGRHIMNRCHGCWSLGLMTGAGLISFFAFFPKLAVLLVIAVLSAGFAWGVAWRLPRFAEEAVNRGSRRRRFKELPPALLFIACFMLATTLAEGAMVDWAAVYLDERLGGVDASAGFAVAVFSGFVAAGRFGGDWMKARLGVVKLARLTTCFALLGLVLLVLPLPVAFAIIGFALVGFGISTAFPLGVSAAAGLGDEHEARNIAVMSTVALSGFLLSPPIIGVLAERWSLSVAFAVLIPGLVLALWLARYLAPESRSDSPDESP